VAPPGDLVVHLRAHVDSVRAARRAIDAVAGLDAHPEQLFNLRLLVTELVANSVRHAGLEADQLITLGVEAGPAAVAVSVTDAGPGFEVPDFEHPPDGLSGRGLFLVDALSDRWGVCREPDRTTVWFEIDL
jgi:anti-sigma regulatory factor (Ser/Thr protein kinase)